MPKLNKPIQVSRPGRFTATSGTEVNFTDATFADVAAIYDPALHQAPLVVGHPKTDDPAYGWVQGLEYADGVLQVSGVDQLDAAFADIVNAGRFNRVSACFFLPDAPNHPCPGHLYLKHVGFLGAAAPAVKGLKPVSFAGGDGGTVTVEFGDVDGWTVAGAISRIGSLLSGVRDYLTEAKGADAAEQAMPRQNLDEIQAAAERMRQQATADDMPVGPSFADPPTKEISMDENALKAREAEVAKREADITAKEAAFADQTRAARHAENVRLIDGLIKEGRFVATQKAATVAFMDGLDATAATVEFADADGKPCKVSQLDAYRAQLAAAPKLVEFGEHPAAGADPAATVDFAAPPGFVVDADRAALHAKALAYQVAHEGIDYLAAVKAVGGK